MIMQSDINLLREPASWSRGARHPRVLNVHSGVCVPGFHNVGSLATISAALHTVLTGMFNDSKFYTNAQIFTGIQ